MSSNDEEKKTVTGRIALVNHASLMSVSIAASLAAMDFSGLEDRVDLFEMSPMDRETYGDFYSWPPPMVRRHKETPPRPNPKADKRKANRVKQMQARRKHRREMSKK